MQTPTVFENACEAAQCLIQMGHTKLGATYKVLCDFGLSVADYAKPIYAHLDALEAKA